LYVPVTHTYTSKAPTNRLHPQDRQPFRPRSLRRCPRLRNRLGHHRLGRALHEQRCEERTQPIGQTDRERGGFGEGCVVGACEQAHVSGCEFPSHPGAQDKAIFVLGEGCIALHREMRLLCLVPLAISIIHLQYGSPLSPPLSPIAMPRCLPQPAHGGGAPRYTSCRRAPQRSENIGNREFSGFGNETTTSLHFHRHLT